MCQKMFNRDEFLILGNVFKKLIQRIVKIDLPLIDCFENQRRRNENFSAACKVKISIFIYVNLLSV